jgi:hypothetical protein
MSGASWLSALVTASRQRLRRLLVCLGLALVAASAAAVGLGFASAATFEALRAPYGAMQASIWMSAGYFVLAGAFYVAYRRARGRTRPEPLAVARAEAAAIDPLATAAEAAGGSQAAAVAVGAELVKQLTPLQLALLAALSGFIAGRRL